MAKLDYEKLLGGYATGTLTQAERQILFEAALHDQTLFNTLADDQALKELLDDAVSRRRLIAALEAIEESQEKPSRWGALVPAWVSLPAIVQSTRRERDTLYASSPRVPAPKTRSWRGALAGGLILGALAVIVAAGLIEEMTSPPQPVLTADARRVGEEPSPSAIPAPVTPPEPPPPVAPEAPQPIPTKPRDSLTVREQRSEVIRDQPARKPIPARPRRDPEPRSMDDVFKQAERRAEASPAAPPPPPIFQAPEMHASTPPQPLPESPGGPRALSTGQGIASSEPPVLSARAQFYAGSGSLDLGRAEALQGRAIDQTKTPSSRFAMSPKAALEEASGPASPQANFRGTIQASIRPLGVRYSLLKKSAGGVDQEISPGAILTGDDETRLTVEVNTAGYLYVLKRTPPEVWTVLYPSLGSVADPAGRAAYVHSGTRYIIPSAGSLTETAGRGPAQLVIIFAREPQPELGSLGAVSTHHDSARAATINDLIRRIRNEVAGGKLLIEHVDPPQEGTPAERAVYVIDRSAAPMPRLLSEIVISSR